MRNEYSKLIQLLLKTAKSIIFTDIVALNLIGRMKSKFPRNMHVLLTLKIYI